MATKLQFKTEALIWAIAGVFAALSILPLIDVCSDQGPCGIFLAIGFGGLLLSAMVTNLHDPNPWLVALFNWVLLGLLAKSVAKLIVRRKRGALLER